MRRREGSDGHLEPLRRERRRLGGELLVLESGAQDVEGVHLRHVHPLALASRQPALPHALAVVSLAVASHPSRAHTQHTKTRTQLLIRS